MKLIKKILMFFIFSSFSLSIFAWDGQITGVIQGVDVTAGANYGFRVTLKDAQKFCGNTTWAYLFESDSNYNTFVSVLLAAKLSEKPVTFYTIKDASGYCHIGYIGLL